MTTVASRASAAGWLRARVPELALVVCALALRVSLTRTFDVTLGYDFPAHEGYLRYLLEHGRLPPYDFNVTTYNPALFYALGAVLLKFGCTMQAVGRISIAASCVQFLLVWLGVELYLREWRLARVLTLATFAILPAAVHIAGFVSYQALSDMFCTGAIVLLPRVMLRPGRAAVGSAVGAGVCLGLALLTKVTGTTILGAFLVTVVVTIARGRVGDDVARRLLPGTAALLAAVAIVCGWHYVRHKVLHGQFVLTAYDHYAEVDPLLKKPYLERRTFGYVGGWDNEIYAKPFWPAASHPYGRFWPLLVATTFSDYYNFTFVPRPKAGEPTVTFNGRPMPSAAVPLARASVVGGTALACLAIAAWLVAARRLWSRGDDGRGVLLMVGLFALLGQLHFAIRYPSDEMGPVKGGYLQFVGPIYCALAALAIATLWRRRALAPRALAVAGMAAIGLVAAYTIYARIIVPLAA